MIQTRNFRKSIPLVLAHEGGFVDHPEDGGGPTNKGITIAVYQRYIDSKGTVADLKKLTDDQAIGVYKTQYWDKVCGDALPSGVDHAMFDFGVNSGPGRANRYLQQILNVSVDGSIGPETLGALAKTNPEYIINRLCDERLAFVSRHSKAKFFLKGWTKRIERVRVEALAMIGEVTTKPPTPPARKLFSLLFRLIGKLLGK